MKLLINYIVIFLVFFTPLAGLAQGFVGTIKNDSAYILQPVNRPSTWEEIASFWGLKAEIIQQANHGLDISAQMIKAEVAIPLSFILHREPCEGCQPVYHLVGQSQGLYRVGKWYGNQPASAIKKMNNLRSDALQPGQKLLVGYVQTGGTALKIQEVPVVEAVVTPPVKNATNPTEPVVQADPKPLETRMELKYTGNGLFESEFVPSSSATLKKSGKAASFKSESGWSDGRFYLLNSSLKAGLIVKITDPATGIIIFAKVVGPLPEMKKNTGLQMRLSNAAAARLGHWGEDEIFELNLEY